MVAPDQSINSHKKRIVKFSGPASVLALKRENGDLADANPKSLLAGTQRCEE